LEKIIDNLIKIVRNGPNGQTTDKHTSEPTFIQAYLQADVKDRVFVQFPAFGAKFLPEDLAESGHTQKRLGETHRLSQPRFSLSRNNPIIRTV
jgi:hypothetical protein